MFNKKTESKKTINIFGKKPEPKKSCGFSSSFKKNVMKSFKEDTKKMSKQDRLDRELACQSVFGMSSDKFMKTILK